MTMILKSKEICPLINCKYRISSSGIGECYGAKENRETEFVCNFIDMKEDSKDEIPYSPDIKIKGKTLIQG